MPRRSTRARAALARTLPALLAALAPALASAQDPSSPVAPGADNFSIRYFLTDGQGNRGRLMTTFDFQRFANLARCECGQKIEAEVRILNVSGTTYSNVPMTAYVGSTCGAIENVVNSTFKRCAIAANGFTSDFQYGGQLVQFSPLWLYRGVDESLGDRDLRGDNAFPAGDCSGGLGASGVWVCAQTDSLSGCQEGEFIITGTQQNNVVEDPMSTMPINGIAFDFVPPQVELSSQLAANVGDRAVELTWALPVVNPDIAGFRVLCESAADGEPGVSGLIDPPSVIPSQTDLNGTIYFTKENVCGDAPFWEAGTTGGGTTGGTTSDTTTDGMTSDGTTSDGTTSDGTTTDGTTTDGTTTDGTTSDTTTTDTTTTDTTTGGVVDVCGGDRPAKGVCSLKWSYVCSAHVAGNAKSVRVSGLDNDTPYNFLLVAYDKAGNPIAVSRIDNVSPQATNDFWDQCEADGGVCGEAGFCRADHAGPLGAAGALGLTLALLGVARRRKRDTAC